ncbi:2'-5'-oligoadenylate synthase 1A-like [Acanthaster planci]|uniref:2'-5'-oligoadenylate synthase 1A-like n=1 Tax=Acanthaster planci TaxID=133434 RepID=A0A8B7YUF3_ACAPL|nr:2'-5'-oligoadenylate synthase 1A-like [Acanthaster planci]XP_022096924.1 2'-5'-oligoadenylate synthase 1A-like [Acanthaster planci]
MGSWFSVGSDPWDLDPSYFEKWYNLNIREGLGKFETDALEAIDTALIALARRMACSKRNLFDVREVIKGGSLITGTATKDLTDIDVVVFVNSPHLVPIGCSSVQDYKAKLKSLIDELAKALGAVPSVIIRQSDACQVNFDFVVGGRSLRVNFFPTADNFSGYALGPSDIFKEMMQLGGYDRGLYSASLVKYQRDFVKNQPCTVKELIRLVKFWAHTCLPQALQKSYPLELITIYRWENTGKPALFKNVQGLKDVLRFLSALQVLRHYWTEMYDEELAEQSITKLGHRNPILLDPANPTNNVCWVYQKGDNIELLKSAAESTLRSKLLTDVIVYPNWWGRRDPYDFLCNDAEN